MKPVMTTKEAMNAVDGRKRIVQSVVSAITLNRATGVILTVLGVAILLVNYLK